MSRGQSTQTFNTASSQNAANFGNAQNAEKAAQGDIGQYQNQLASFVSGNPYTQGGEYDQTINAGLANSSNAASNSLRGALQSQALRTGQNSAADAATAASAANANEQNLSAQQANAQQQRISNEAGYNQQALSASAEPAQMESSLYGTSGSQGNQELGTEEGAAKTPSFWDTLGNGIAGGISGGISGVGAGYGRAIGSKCWIAAELYGGWYDPRTVLIREWLDAEFTKNALGRVVVALYVRYGERTAKLIHEYPILRRVFLPIFNAALSRAR